MSTNTEHQERMWRLAKAERDHDVCGGRGVYEDQLREEKVRIIICHPCKATGKVPLLPGVRIECLTHLDSKRDARPIYGGKAFAWLRSSDHKPVIWECPDCHGLGYGPSDDPMVWAKALAPLIPPIHLMQYALPLASGDFPAGLEAAERALIGGGVIKL